MEITRGKICFSSSLRETISYFLLNASLWNWGNTFFNFSLFILFLSSFRELIILCWKLRGILSARIESSSENVEKCFHVWQCDTFLREEIQKISIFTWIAFQGNWKNLFFFEIQKFLQDVIKYTGTTVNWKFLILNDIYLRKNFLFDFIIRIIKKKY